MLETTAKIISSVFIGLGSPESELLQEFEVAQVVYRKLAYYYEGIRQSDQNLSAKKTAEFTLATADNSKDLTALATDIITPLWCEQKIVDSTNDTWRHVPTINMDTLPERRERGMMAVGFYGNIATQITAEFSCYGSDLSTPYNTFRVWYDSANTFSANKDATISIPDNLTYIVEIDATLGCIRPLLINASKYIDKRPELAARISAWEGLKLDLLEEKAAWTVHFETWRKRSRAAHRAVNHNDVLGWDRDGRY